MRSGEWRKIPNNTLAEEDIIKLLPDDTAPALIVALREDDDELNPLNPPVPLTLTLAQMASPQLGGLSREPSSKQGQRLYFNKGSKIDTHAGAAHFARASPNDASAPNEAL